MTFKSHEIGIFIPVNPILLKYRYERLSGLAKKSEICLKFAISFSFNGQEKTDEIAGAGNHFEFKFRGYDPRTGRFWSPDPLHSKYPWNSDYAFAENDVIRCIDLEGLEKYYSQDGTLQWSYGTSTKVMLVNDDFVNSNKGHNVALKDLNPNSQYTGMNQAELNTRAFLTLIRKGEGTLGESGYKKQFGGEQFSDFTDHPNEVIKKSGYFSSAAGAYQILSRTWYGKAGTKAKTNLGITDFSPQSQDKFGVWLIGNRGALDDVINGNLENAISKTNKEWASLPESPYGQPTQTVEGAKVVFKNAVSKELQGKSEVSTPQGQLDGTIEKVKR